MEKQQTNSNKKALPPILLWIKAGVAFGFSYLLISFAIDSGSLLLYAGAAVMFALGVRDFIQAFKAMRNTSK